MMASARAGELRIHIDEPPDKTWVLLANLERMGGWSPERHRVERLDGASPQQRGGLTSRGGTDTGRCGGWT
jgi:hypothetical protein